MSTYSLELGQNDLNNPETMQALSDIMEKAQDAWVHEIQKLAEELNIPDDFASAVFYLRTRSRHTRALEQELVEMGRRGEECPNMCEWP